MMTFSRRYHILVFLLSITSALSAHVNVNFPVGGETFVQGYSVVVEWSIAQPHDLQDWDVYYSTDAGETWIPLAIDLPPAQLTYEWVIPMVETTLGKIKVYMNNSKDDYIDYSGEFTIVPNTSPPAVDVPAQDLILSCNTNNQQAAIQAWLINHGDASIINYCGNLIWTNDYLSLSNDCGATGEAYVTFTATDQCGSTETIALLRIQDDTPPTLTTPATHQSVETDGQGNIAQLNTWLNSKGGATATDACGAVTWTNDFVAINTACGQAGSATVTFTATDACGNAITTTATFLITDDVDPTILLPAQNLTIPVSASSDSLIQQWLNNHAGADAYDLGGAVTWTNNFNGLNGCGASGITAVTFTATDPCGNRAVTIATLHVTDTTPPVFVTNANSTIAYCGDSSAQAQLQQWLDNHGGASASDAGGDITWQHNFKSLSDGCGNSGSAAVTFSASDPCGNTANTVGTFQIADTVSPNITLAPLDTTVYCHHNNVPALLQSWVNRQGGAFATDECSSVSWTNNFNGVVDTCQLVSTYTIAFTAMDECLNNQIATAKFIVIDSAITSVKDVVELPFQVYPNPVHDQLTVEFETSGNTPVYIELLDAVGRKVWTAQSSKKQTIIPVNEYSSGVYFLNCKKELSTGTKIVIID